MESFVLEQASTTHAPDGSDGRFGLRYTAENLLVSGRHGEYDIRTPQPLQFTAVATSVPCIW